MGRNSSGVKGISLSAEDELVGMVVADPEATLLTACQNGYGKRTHFGPNSADGDESDGSEAESGGEDAASLGRRYLKSHGVRLGGLVVGFAVLTLLVDFTDVTLRVAGADFWPTVANGIGIGCGMVLNYVAESLITWRVHR